MHEDSLEKTDEANLALDYQHSFEVLAKAVAGFASVVEQLLTAAVKSTEQWSGTINSLAEIDWQKVSQRLEDLPAHSKECMRTALSKGWFFGWHDDLQTVYTLIDTLLSVPAEQVDEVMIAFYRPRIGEYTDRLVGHHPTRSAPILAARNAHLMMSEEGYLLSIPVFIAQADGMLAQTFGMENALKKIGKIVKQRFADDPEKLDLLQPLLELESSKFMMSSGKRPEDFEGLNRHQVLHGEVSDYGTEVNSLKAFSFLVFVGLHLPVTAPDLAKPSTPF